MFKIQQKKKKMLKNFSFTKKMKIFTKKKNIKMWKTVEN